MASAVTAVQHGPYVVGNRKQIICDVALTGSYATGGETLDPKAFGLSRIITVTGIATEAAEQTTAWAVHWTGSKLKLFGAGTGSTGLTEHAAASYAASTVAHLTVVGE